MERASDDAVLTVTRSLAIPLAELRWKFSASGSPGGQHANTANTKVELRFSIAESPSLGPRQRARLLERLGPEVRLTSTAGRSQSRNRDDAMARLRGILADALVVPVDRRPTRATRGSVERRLDGKRRQSVRKRERRAEPDDG